MSNVDLSLASRAGLPEALRVLLADYPRDGWRAHPQFTGLVQFWLERHMSFRDLLAVLEADSAGVLDRQIDPQRYAARLSRFGAMLVNQLHGHHQIEDGHYFPILVGLDDRIAPGFDILDADHQAMDGLLHRFTLAANGVIGAVAEDAQLREAAAGFRAELLDFGRMLDRHLNDEEELIVPVILNNPGALA